MAGATPCRVDVPVTTSSCVPRWRRINSAPNSPTNHLSQTAVDDKGEPLTGAQKYILHFAKDHLPPVSVFWNLAMDDQDNFFIENDFGRYSIGSTTDGLKSNPDGSLTITIQKDRPTDTSNWLPAPDGPFNLTMRLYGPEPSVLDGSYRLQPVRGSNKTSWPHCERTTMMKRMSTIAAFALSLAIGWPLGFPTAVAQHTFAMPVRNTTTSFYFSKPADWKFQFTTPNASTHYVYFNFNLKDGPVVLDIPPTVGAGSSRGVQLG